MDQTQDVLGSRLLVPGSTRHPGSWLNPSSWILAQPVILDLAGQPWIWPVNPGSGRSTLESDTSKSGILNLSFGGHFS